ncbi:MAG: MFS transporter [Saprospiraceae bacterium]|nr:MFS transporter [Saprospiraceae bacterium]
MKGLLFTNRNFFLLWLAQVVSGLGNVLYAVGIMVGIYNRTQSAFRTTFVLVIVAIPAFFLSPLAGAVADRFNRKWVILITDFARMCITPLFLLALHDDGINRLLLLAVLMCLSIGGTFRYPSRMAIIPELVEKEQLTKANSILIGTSQAIVAVGYGLGGLLTLLLSFTAFVWFNAATFMVAGICMLIMKTSYAPPPRNRDRPSLGTSIVEGVRATRRHKYAFPLILMEAIEHLPHGIWAATILLAFVERSLGGTEADWGYISGAYFVGMFVGAMIAHQRSSWLGKRTGWIIVVNAFLTSLMTFVFAWSPSIAAAIAICILFGLPNAIRDVAQDTLLQSKVEKGLLGRVYSFRNMLCSFLYTFAALTFAWMADHHDVRLIYYAGAVLYVFSALYGLSSRSLRESAIEERESQAG